MPELERLMLSELARLDGVVREAYEAFDFKRVYFALFAFMTNDLSAFYFDIRKDRLYCDPASSKRAARGADGRSTGCSTAWCAGSRRCCPSPARRRGPSGTAASARCISSSSRTSRRTGATRRSRRSGRRSARSAASSPARWRSSAARSASARRSRRRRASSSPMPDLLQRCWRRRHGGGRDHQPARCWKPARGRAEAFRLPDVPGVAVVSGARRRTQMRALVEDPAGGRLRSGLSRPVAARRRRHARIRCRARGCRIDGERQVRLLGLADRRSRRSSVDQAHKAWMLGPFDIAEQGPRGADAVPRPRHGLEPRRQLRALHAGRRCSAAGC